MKKFLALSSCIIILLTIVSCKKETPMIDKTSFGKISTGQETELYTLTNKTGCQAKITNYGAVVVSLTMPDKTGKLEDVVLGYDDAASYEKGTSYFGAIVGRYGNRIGKGKFTLDGKEYQLALNNGANTLHGGNVGFNKVIWEVEPVVKDEGPSLKLTYVSKDGEEGYPGTLKLVVVYTLTDANELKIEYTATTDKTTILNPTHHSYFNLTGNPVNTILDEELMIDANAFTPIDAGLIPTGKLESVDKTPMDFRAPVKIGARIEDKYEQLIFGKGYDHNWVLNNYDKNVRQVAAVYDKASGRTMAVLTDQPGIQFYSGNFLDGTAKGKNGVMYQFRTGLCLETQHFPDSPNKPDFPSVKLNPGETYHQTTIYKFSVSKE